MILDGQQQAKPKVLSKLTGRIPFADLDRERFVDQYNCQPVVVDLPCYLRELSRHDKLSPIVSGIYDVVADTTGAREETLEWAIGVLIGPPCHYFTEEELQTVLNSHRLHQARRREDLADQIAQLGAAPQHNVAALPPPLPENEGEVDDDSLFYRVRCTEARSIGQQECAGNMKYCLPVYLT